MIQMTSTAANSTGATDLHATRELWLEHAIEVFRPRFDEVGFPLPERFHVSVGFGYGAKRESAKLLGQCWSGLASTDGFPHVFISPEMGDTMEVLRTLLHELIHGALDSPEGIQDGHTKRFAEIATRLGFEGKMTETPASVGLQAELFTVAAALGDYPHGALDVAMANVPVPVPVGSDPHGPRTRTRTGPNRQTNRHIKIKCPCCGYVVRTTAKYLALGLPRCPSGTEMTVTD
jgi:hypothetical protein